MNGGCFLRSPDVKAFNFVFLQSLSIISRGSNILEWLQFFGIIVIIIIGLPVLDYPGTPAQCKLCPGYNQHFMRFSCPFFCC